MLHINNPKYAKERAESKPLSLEEQKNIVEAISIVFDLAGVTESNTLRGTPVVCNLQRLLFHYENLQALSDFVGGWEGAEKMCKD